MSWPGAAYLLFACQLSIGKSSHSPQVDLEALRELAWSGVPAHLRSMCWRLLLGYLPPNSERRDAILARKRREYRWGDVGSCPTAAGDVHVSLFNS